MKINSNILKESGFFPVILGLPAMDVLYKTKAYYWMSWKKVSLCLEVFALDTALESQHQRKVSFPREDKQISR